MTIKACVNIMAASTKVWPTIGGWTGDGAGVAYSVWASYCFG